MIRQGRANGWLTVPLEALPPWASLNGATLDHVKPGVIPGRGGALLASIALDASKLEGPLLRVPRDLILGIERIQEHARVDRDFREVLASLSEFGRVGVIPFSFSDGALSKLGFPSATSWVTRFC